MKKFTKKYITYAALLAVQLLILAGCGAEKTAETAEPALPEIYINELMSSNRASLSGPEESFPQWAELYNGSQTEAVLLNCSLSSGRESMLIPELRMAAGEYRLIFLNSPADGGAGLELEGDSGCLSLLAEDGRTVSTLSYTDALDDMSIVRGEDGRGEICIYPSPGYENSPEGYALYQSELEVNSPLIINEAMTYNKWYMGRSGEYYDWVELKNVSQAAVRLSDYTLSDKCGRREEVTLPDLELAPGECRVLLCTGDGNGLPFSLSSESEALFLRDSQGRLMDYAALRDIGYGCSMGRLEGENGFFYFEVPSPGDENTGGARCTAEKPRAIGADGVFNGTGPVSVSLEAPGKIYYTLDGSEPDENSSLYTGPIEFTQTGVLRAVNIEEGKLKSEPLSLSYIINENHSLPVVSLVAEPGDLFGGRGIYANPTEDWERQCSVSLFDGENGFSIDCGMKIHGATSRIAQEKKSFKLCFKPRYEGHLKYDLFSNGVTEFESLVLRSAQESSWSTQMRDIIMHRLSRQCCPELPTQDYKFCVLYINGEYWGVYALREAHSAYHYAQHYGYDADTVSMWQGVWGKGTSCEELYRFMKLHDMSDADNYHYVADHFDIESFIAWNIIQCYGGNIDANSPNVRFYYSSQDDMMRIVLVDLDLTMFATGSGFEIPFFTTIGYAFNDYALNLLENPEYQSRFIAQLTEYLDGPLSDENVLREIDLVADEIRDEIGRDFERWGGRTKTWENMVDGLRYFVTAYGGRRAALAYSIEDFIKISPEELAAMLGE